MCGINQLRHLPNKHLCLSHSQPIPPLPRRPVEGARASRRRLHAPARGGPLRRLDAHPVQPRQVEVGEGRASVQQTPRSGIVDEELAREVEPPERGAAALRGDDVVDGGICERLDRVERDEAQVLQPWAAVDHIVDGIVDDTPYAVELERLQRRQALHEAMHALALEARPGQIESEQVGRARAEGHHAPARDGVVADGEVLQAQRRAARVLTGRCDRREAG